MNAIATIENFHTDVIDFDAAFKEFDRQVALIEGAKILDLRLVAATAFEAAA